MSFDSHGTRCEGWYVPALNDDWATSRGRPCVVMAHGFGGTRDSGLLPYAERFAAAGADVLVFDYRGFGTSDGAVRQDVDHRRHREDYHAALAFARARPGVDPSRVALWGTSYSGGHVVAVAAKDGQVAAVISQNAALDGAEAMLLIQKVSGVAAMTSVTGAGLRDLARGLRGQPPLMIPIVGAPGSGAALSSPGSLEGYNSIAAPSFRNEMRARGGLRVSMNRPIRVASKLRCPVLFVVAEHDNLAPVSAVHRAAKRIPRSEVISFPVNHFDLYTGEVFEKSVVDQVEFLGRTIGG